MKNCFLSYLSYIQIILLTNNSWNSSHDVERGKT
jgi:hypothetical protein